MTVACIIFDSSTVHIKIIFDAWFPNYKDNSAGTGYIFDFIKQLPILATPQSKGISPDSAVAVCLS